MSGSVVVKSAAKALSGGAVGDLINVELIPGRKRLVATVAGPMLVRISGKATVRTEPEEPQGESSPKPRSNHKNPMQGAMRETGRLLDVAIDGPGLLQVSHPRTQQIYYTRVGNLDVNADNQLIIGSGQTEFLIEPPIVVPINAETIVIDPTGRVMVRQAGANKLQDIGNLQLAWFANPEGLAKADNNMFVQTNPANRAIAEDPGTDGMERCAKASWKHPNKGDTR